MAAAGDDLEGGLTSGGRLPRPANRPQSMPPIAHCVAFCGAFGLVFAVSGAVLLSSGLPYRRLQLRIISACMLALGVVLLTCAVVLTLTWRRQRTTAARRQCRRQHRSAALVIRVPTVSAYMYASDTVVQGAASTETVSPASPLPPPPSYDDVVHPPPSYASVMMLKELEKAAQARRQAAEAQRRGSAPPALRAPALPVQM